MSPEYLEELADRADPDKLWRLSGIDQRDLSEEQRHQMLTGVALRRHASYVRALRGALTAGKSLCVTPLGTSGFTQTLVDPPPEHQRLIDQRRAAPERA